MGRYLISFPSSAMDLVADDEWSDVADAAHAVIREAKDAGVYRFSGGLNADVPPVLVAADSTTTAGSYPESARLDGGFAVVDVDSREEALEWAARMAAACRCAQEVREFHDDPLA
jgi:hypothetical protein